MNNPSLRRPAFRPLPTETFNHGGHRGTQRKARDSASRMINSTQDDKEIRMSEIGDRA